jgi:hypothetical protein
MNKGANGERKIGPISNTNLVICNETHTKRNKTDSTCSWKEGNKKINYRWETKTGEDMLDLGEVYYL